MMHKGVRGAHNLALGAGERHDFPRINTSRITHSQKPCLSLLEVGRVDDEPTQGSTNRAMQSAAIGAQVSRDFTPTFKAKESPQHCHDEPRARKQKPKVHAHLSVGVGAEKVQRADPEPALCVVAKRRGLVSIGRERSISQFSDDPRPPSPTALLPRDERLVQRAGRASQLIVVVGAAAMDSSAGCCATLSSMSRTCSTAAAAG